MCQPSQLKPAAAPNALFNAPEAAAVPEAASRPVPSSGYSSDYGGSMAFATHDNVKPAKRKRPQLFSNGRFANDWRVGSYIR
jgi:hypothetical protein